jgi:hypothetical protein
LVKYSLTKEIGKQIKAKIELAKKDSNENIYLNHLNRGQDALDRASRHMGEDGSDNDGGSEENLLVDPKEAKEIQKELDKAFKELIEKRVHKVIDSFDKKNGGFDAFRSAIIKNVDSPHETGARYGSAKGNDARMMVVKALEAKKAELEKTLGSQSDEEKKVADKIKVTQISGLIAELRRINK